MTTPRDLPWDELDLSRLRLFLEDAPDEALLWDAKGSNPRGGSFSTSVSKPLIKAACGMANSQGGCAIVGVDEKRNGEHRTWDISGVEMPSGDPLTDLANTMTNGFAVPPRFDAKAWQLDNGKHVAVVRVWPETTPPAITSDGVVYKRLSGATQAVKDPGELRDLLHGGRAAVAHRRQAVDARARTQFGMEELHRIGTDDECSFISVALVASDYEHPSHVATFTERFRSALHRSVEERAHFGGGLQPAFYCPSKVTGEQLLVAGPAVYPQDLGPNYCQRQWVAAGDDAGVVTVQCRLWNVKMAAEMVVRDPLLDCLIAARSLLRQLGGRGTTHLAVSIVGPLFVYSGGASEHPVAVHRDLSDDELSGIGKAGWGNDLVLESVSRELQRHTGIEALEPYPWPEKSLT